MGLQWDVPPEQALGVVYDEYRNRIRMVVEQLLRSYQPRIEAWMKENASWTDRTANARQSLYADVQRLGQDTFDLIMDHGMDYGRFLEFSNAGRYAIIAPAVDVFAPQIFDDLQSILS